MDRGGCNGWKRLPAMFAEVQIQWELSMWLFLMASGYEPAN